MIFCQTLGPPVVRLDDGSAPASLQWRKNLALLVYLARSPKRARRRDHLLGLLWGDQPQEKARASLNQALLTLRSYVGPALESDKAEVRLTDGAVTLDVEQLDALAASGDHAQAARLVVGLFLEGFVIDGASQFEDWMTAEQAYWLRRSVDVLLRVGAAALAAGDVRSAQDAARRVVQLDPYSDLGVQALMRAHALAGDPGSARAEFTSFAARLTRDVGGAPGPETRALADRLPAPSSPPGPRSAASAREPLVGRAMELARIMTLWERCRADGGHVAIVFLEGDGGTGKSRLVEEVAARATLDGAIVAAARAVEADQADAWSGVLTIARAGLLGAPGIAAVAPDALRQVRGETPLTSPRSFSDVLRAVAEEHPVLIVIDDAHWVDRESVLALGAAARDLGSAPVLLLVAVNRSAPRAELDDMRSRLGRDVQGMAIALGPLAVDDVRALARSSAPTLDDVQLERLTRRIVADSAAIPLLAVELLRAVAAGLDLRLMQKAWPEPLRTLEQTLPGDLPDAVTAAIRVNFNRLSKAAQQVLKVAAVVGGRVSVAVLARGSGQDGAALAAALDELEWQRWLAAETRGYSFVARIVRDVVYQDMVLPGERERILKLAGT